MAAPSNIVLFHYPGSIYSDRVLWYLHLRRIPYAETVQPAQLPRPDLVELSIAYRRIPILAIGRDVYFDTSLILDKLETLDDPTYQPPLGIKSGEGRGIEKLLETWAIDGFFTWSVQCVAIWKFWLFQSEEFLDDRERLIGHRMSVDEVKKGRPQALSQIRHVFNLLESGLLADGRRWVLNTEGPALADIHAIFSLQWLFIYEDSLPDTTFGPSKFPRIHAWIHRFRAATAEAKAKSPLPTNFETQAQLVEMIHSGPRLDRTVLPFDEDDPTALELNSPVEIAVTGYGSTHRDRGLLISLTVHTAVILNERDLHLHFPRWNFSITPLPNHESKSIPAPLIPAPAPLASRPPQHLKLIYHPMSPYSRKVYMHALELGIQDLITLKQVVVAPIDIRGWSDDNEYVARFNPFAKIPTLVAPRTTSDADSNEAELERDDAQGIFDSRAICSYLSAIASPGKPLVVDVVSDTLHATADALLDARVLIVYEANIRAKTDPPMNYPPWEQGQMQKITRGLDYLERLAAGEGPFALPMRHQDEKASVGEVALAAALAFLEIGQMRWQGERPALESWFVKAWRKRQSFQRTLPDIDWKTGKATDDGGFARAVVEAKAK